MPALIAIALCCSIPLLAGVALWPWRKLGSRKKPQDVSAHQKEETNG